MLGTRGVIYERGLAPLLREALAELGRRRCRRGAGRARRRQRGRVARGRGRLRDRRRRGWPRRRRDLARRHLHRVHRRHHGPTQGGALAPGRPVRRRHRRHRRHRRGRDPGRGPRPAPGVWFPTSPLMHVAAQWTVFLAASMGATVVLHDDSRRFDAPTILATAARERANMMTIIGDAYARPLARGAAHERVRPLGAGRARHRRHAHQRAAPRTRSPRCCPASPSVTATARRRSA